MTWQLLTSRNKDTEFDYNSEESSAEFVNPNHRGVDDVSEADSYSL
jgi:hypothetical protein